MWWMIAIYRLKRWTLLLYYVLDAMVMVHVTKPTIDRTRQMISNMPPVIVKPIGLVRV